MKHGSATGAGAAPRGRGEWQTERQKVIPTWAVFVIVVVLVVGYFLLSNTAKQRRKESIAVDFGKMPDFHANQSSPTPEGRDGRRYRRPGRRIAVARKTGQPRNQALLVLAHRFGGGRRERGGDSEGGEGRRRFRRRRRPLRPRRRPAEGEEVTPDAPAIGGASAGSEFPFRFHGRGMLKAPVIRRGAWSLSVARGAGWSSRVRGRRACSFDSTKGSRSTSRVCARQGVRGRSGVSRALDVAIRRAGLPPGRRSCGSRRRTALLAAKNHGRRNTRGLQGKRDATVFLSAAPANLGFNVDVARRGVTWLRGLPDSPSPGSRPGFSAPSICGCSAGRPQLADPCQRVAAGHLRPGARRWASSPGGSSPAACWSRRTTPRPTRRSRPRSACSATAPAASTRRRSATTACSSAPTLSSRTTGSNWALVEVKSSTEVKPEHITDLGIQAYVLRGAGVPGRQHAPAPPQQRLRLSRAAPTIWGSSSPWRMSPRRWSRSSTPSPGCSASSGRCSPAPCPRSRSAGAATIRTPAPSTATATATCPSSRSPRSRASRTTSSARCSATATAPSARCRSTTRASLRPSARSATSSRPGRRASIPSSRMNSPGWASPSTSSTSRPGVPRSRSFPAPGPTRRFPVQWSCHTLDGGLRHAEFLHTDRTDPRRAFAQSLLAALGADNGHADDSPIVVYTGYENRILAELARDLPEFAAPIAAVQARLFDLAQAGQHLRPAPRLPRQLPRSSTCCPPWSTTSPTRVWPSRTARRPPSAGRRPSTAAPRPPSARRSSPTCAPTAQPIHWPWSGCTRSCCARVGRGRGASWRAKGAAR